MRKAIIIIITLIAGGASAEVMALRNIDIGDLYPSFCVQQLDKSQICSSRYKKNILITSFVRINQKQSLKILLTLQDLHALYSTKDVSIICILSGDVDQQELMAFVDKNKITLPLFFDKNREVYGSFGVVAYPTITVSGQDGRLSYLFGSNTINIRKRLEGCIRFLLKEIEVSELEKIMHPVVETIDYEHARAERYYNFAKNSFASHHFSRAKKIVESSLENYPEHALFHSLYGYILIQEEDYKLALNQFELALKFNTDLKEAKTGKQICLDNLKR